MPSTKHHLSGPDTRAREPAIGRTPLQETLSGLERLISAFRSDAERAPTEVVETDRAWDERLVPHCGNERLISIVQQLRAAALRFELQLLENNRMRGLRRIEHVVFS